jgi:hypothetical protein
VGDGPRSNQTFGFSIAEIGDHDSKMIGIFSVDHRNQNGLRLEMTISLIGVSLYRCIGID